MPSVSDLCAKLRASSAAGRKEEQKRYNEEKRLISELVKISKKQAKDFNTKHKSNTLFEVYKYAIAFDRFSIDDYCFLKNHPKQFIFFQG